MLRVRVRLRHGYARLPLPIFYITRTMQHFNYFTGMYFILTIKPTRCTNLSNWPTQSTNSCFIISLLYSSTCFENYVLIIRQSKLYYTTCGIITLCRWPSGAQDGMIPDDI